MSTLLRRFRASLENPAVPLSSGSLLSWMVGPGTDAGVSVNEHSALGMPAVWRAVNLIAGTCASLPLRAYRADGGVWLPMASGAGAALLANPHPDLTPYEFWEIEYTHQLLWGNGYARKLRNQLGQVVELWPLHPARVKVGRDSETAQKWFTVDGDTQNPLSEREVLHLPGFGYDGVCGVSPIRLARQGIGLALAAEKYGAKLFGNGSLMTGILQTEQRLEPGQADALKARWKAKMTGLDHAHDVAVLDSGAKFQQLSIAPEDAQFIESRRFQIQEVARMFGIPPWMLGDVTTSTSWGTGIEQQTIGFVTYTLRTWLTRVEQRMTQLIAPGTVSARYDVDELMRGDEQARSAFYTAMWNIGAFSTNDIRSKENLPGVEGGDVRYRPLNMGVLGAPDPAALAAGAGAGAGAAS